jgi:hypothetical protein
MYVKVWGKSDRRRSPGYDVATVDGMKAAQRLGVTFLTYMGIYRDSQHNGCQHRQREELAQHTVVRPSCHCRQVAMTIMMHAVSALRFYCLTCLMHVNRR